MGRSQELTQLHDQLQQSHQLAITAIAGMGGIGKSELALQYGLHHLEQATYPGGICWLRARESEVGSQLVTFARSRLGLNLPEGLELEAQVGWCWQHWREGKVLLILDDVTNYALIQPYLPPPESRFQVLLTTRLQLGRSFQTLNLGGLSEAAALDFLKSLTDPDRIDRQLNAAKQLAQWLGYLPLGLELVGRYLAQKPDLSLAEMQQRLEAKRLDARALRQVEAGMMAPLGVAAAFELSWQELDAMAQELCYLLSWFALAPIAWQWVEQCFPDRDLEEIEDLRDQQLIRFSLLQRSGEQTYLLHQLIREFFQHKFSQAKSIAQVSEQVEPLQQALCGVMAAIARTVPPTPTLTEIAQLTLAIPHLEATARHQTEHYHDQDLAWAFIAVAQFYEGQGQYSQAEPWYENCVAATRQRLGENHPVVATSFNNLAELYRAQGRYTEAEQLYFRSLSIYEQQLGESHRNVGACLNNLALLYTAQRRYNEAESFYLRSLSSQEKVLGESHPQIAILLNNLAELYHSQGFYKKAEPLLIRAFFIAEQQLGENHPDMALCLHNLAFLYQSQGRCSEAEPLYVRSLAIREQQLGETHPDVAGSLNNLALLYYSQGRYSEAEPLFVRSLAIYEQQLGKTHPKTQTVWRNFVSFLQQVMAAGQTGQLSDHRVTQGMIEQLRSG